MHKVQGTAISNELKPLTGIRGFAAFMVVMYHFQGFSILFPALGTLDPLWKVGGLGVDLFFILSGFILAYVYSSGEGALGLKPYLKFLWFRFARLYPNHFATLLVLCLLVVSAKIFGQPLTGNYPSGSLPHQLTMLHAWPYAPGSDGSQWNFPSWSISAEWFAYVFIFPLAWYLLRIGQRMRGWLLPIAFVPLVLWLFLSQQAPLLPFFPLLQVSLQFLTGSLLFAIFKQPGNVFMSITQRGLDLIVIFIVIGIFALHGKFAAAHWILLALPCIIMGLTSETSIAARILAHPVSCWFGNVSYALYMTHAVTQKILKVLFPLDRYAGSPFVVRLGVLTLYLAALLIAAVALYYLVETPSRNGLRRVYLKWKSNTTPACAEAPNQTR